MIGLIALIIIATIVVVYVIGKDKVCAKVPIPLYCKEEMCAAPEALSIYPSSGLMGGISAAEGYSPLHDTRAEGLNAFADSKNAGATPSAATWKCCGRDALDPSKLRNELAAVLRTEAPGQKI